MKKLIMSLSMVAFYLISFSAHAGNLKFTCKNANGSILITRDKLVLLTKDEAEQYDLEVLNNHSVNTMPNKNEIIRFESETNEEKLAGQLRITAVSSRKTIASDGNEKCNGGHEAGFSTESYKIKGQISMNDGKEKTVRLTCVESSYWSGTCKYNED